MAEDQLLAHPVDDVVQIELAGGIGHAGVEHDLQKHVAQLLLHVLVIHGVDGLGHLIGLLQHIAPDGLVGLYPVPGTAVGGTEDLHDANQIVHAVTL